MITVPEANDDTRVSGGVAAFFIAVFRVKLRAYFADLLTEASGNQKVARPATRVQLFPSSLRRSACLPGSHDRETKIVSLKENRPVDGLCRNEIRISLNSEPFHCF